MKKLIKTHVESTKATPLVPMIELTGGQFAEKAFYDDVLLHAGRGVMTMKEMRLYTVRELCGETFWQSMTNKLKRIAGRCFAHMVSNKVFDLQFIQYKKSRTKRYLMLDDI